jgi:hypothetical protein
MKIIHIYSFLLLGLCYGCILTTAPPNDVDFSSAESIRAFEGCFQNLGEGGNGAGKRFLSAVIWPKLQLDHSEIKVIRVVATNAKTLRVTAEAQGTILHEMLFVEGTDFHLNSGRIKVKGDPLVSFAYPAGNVFIGVGYVSEEIGIDASGDGKFQGSSAFAGTAFLVIPVAGGVSDSVRFRKSQELCNGSR